MTLVSTSGSGISVMLVDDSAVIRGALTRIIDPRTHINVVASVRDGSIAVEKARELKPHIIILDIEMPVMDGLTALPKILSTSPDSKVIMFSSLTAQGAAVTLKAMQLGAVECIVKPSSTTDVGEGSEFQKKLISLIEHLAPKGAMPASATPATATPPPSSRPSNFQLRQDPIAFKGKPKIVAIGSSTGGPQALFEVLKNCTGFDVPIVITQHMPATFTTILAQHITQQTGIPTSEGAEGMFVEKGKAYVAPGGFHMKFKLDGDQLKITLDNGPQVNFCKPAVDPMYDSLIDFYGQRVLGVILTGMGSDGLGGGKRLASEHGYMIAQDEITSVVWGMPGAVAQAGVCNEVLPLKDIGPRIKQFVMG